MRLSVLLCLAIFVSMSSIADACSCTPPPPPKKALAQSSAVFVGKVTKIDRSGRMLRVTLSISQTWKGTKGKTVTVVTSSSGASCGFGFKKGQQYLVYTYTPPKRKKGVPPVLNASLCSRTRSLKQAAADLKALGKGKKP